MSRNAPDWAPRLDWVPRFDPRSRNYRIGPLVEGKPLRGRGWYVPTVLNQGQEGACVGFAWSHELAAIPVKASVTNATARLLYHAAQQVDEWDGEAYEGTSVLAGAKVVRGLGHMGAYRWAFTLDELLAALAHEGPVVLGINWYESMFYPDRDGWVRVGGEVAGGHAILAYGLSVSNRSVQLHQSWGTSWGRAGRCRISWDDLERLLVAEQGEACVPMARHKVAA